MLSLYKPAFQELSYRQKILSDPATMAYNEPWGGTIDFSPDRWEAWSQRWLRSDEKTFFYRYLRLRDGTFVGEAAWRCDQNDDCPTLSILIEDRFRRRGYGREALRLLLSAAKDAGFLEVCDHIAHHSPAIDLFLQEGFVKTKEDADGVLLYKKL